MSNYFPNLYFNTVDSLLSVLLAFNAGITYPLRISCEQMQWKICIYKYLPHTSTSDSCVPIIPPLSQSVLITRRRERVCIDTNTEKNNDFFFCLIACVHQHSIVRSALLAPPRCPRTANKRSRTIEKGTKDWVSHGAVAG